MVDIVCKRQSNDGINWKCGVVCLDMIFLFFKIPFDVDAAWGSIKTKRASDDLYVLTHKLAAYSIKEKLYATIYKGQNCSILTAINSLHIPAILSVTQSKTAAGHYIVFKGISKDNFIICDPDETNDSIPVSENEMEEIWKENAEANVSGNILLAFRRAKDEQIECEHCHEVFPIVYSRLIEFSDGVICPFCDTNNGTKSLCLVCTTI